MNNTVYGGLTSYPATPFLIDKVYNNRAEMDENCENDGVFLGRYVMIRYCEENYDQEARKALHEKVNLDEAGQTYVSDYNSVSEQGTKYLDNYLQDLNSGYDADIFFGNLETSEYYSYDHTIWRKEQVPVYEIQETTIETEYGTDLQRNKVQTGIQLKYAPVANCNISYAPVNVEINEAKGAGQIVKGEPYKAGTAEVFGWYCKKTGEDKDGNPVFANYGNWAEGAGSHAEGVGTYANGHGAHAEGSGNGFDVDNPSRPTNLSNIDEETRVRAKGNGAHAEGRYTFAQGNGAHAEGLRTEASAGGAHAEGIGTLATNYYAHAEGQGSQAKGVVSHAEGDNTTASGTASHSEGYGAKAYGDHAHAEGNYAKAIGQDSHAEGVYTMAEGIGAHAEGEYTKSIGRASHAEGLGDKNAQGQQLYVEAIGDYSHAEGYCTKAEKNASHAGGAGTIASEPAQTTIGQYNDWQTQGVLFAVGNGKGFNDRSNAFEVYKDGTAKVKYKNTEMSPVVSEAYVRDNIYRNYTHIDKINPTIWRDALMPYPMRSWVLSSKTSDGRNYLIPIIPLNLSEIFKAMDNQSTLNMTIQTVLPVPYQRTIGDNVYEFIFDASKTDYKPLIKGNVRSDYNLAEYLLVQEVNEKRTGTAGTDDEVNTKKTYWKVYETFLKLGERPDWWKTDVETGAAKYYAYNEIAYDTVFYNEDNTEKARHRTFPDPNGLYGSQLEIIKTQPYRGRAVFTQLTVTKKDNEADNLYNFQQYEGLFSSYGTPGAEKFYSVWGGWNLIVNKTQKSFFHSTDPYLGGYLFN